MSRQPQSLEDKKRQTAQSPAPVDMAQFQMPPQFSFGDMSSLMPFLPTAKDANDPNNALHLRRFTDEYDDAFDAFDDGMKTPMAGGLANNGFVGPHGSLDYFASTIGIQEQPAPVASGSAVPLWPQTMQYSFSGPPNNYDMARRPSIDPLQAVSMQGSTFSNASSNSSGSEAVITPELVMSNTPAAPVFGKGIPPRSSSMSNAESQSRAPLFAYPSSAMAGSSFTSLRQVASRDSFYTAFSSPSSRATSPDTAVSMSYAASPASFHEPRTRSDSDAASTSSRVDGNADVAPLTNAAAARIDSLHGENARLRSLADNLSIGMPPRKRSKQDDEDEMEHQEAAAPKAKRSSKADKHPVYHFSIRVENGVTIDETPDPGQPEAKYFTPTEDQLGLMDPRKRKQWKNCLNSRKNRKGQKEELAELREYRDLTEALVPNLQAQVAQLQAELEQERSKAKQLDAEKTQLQMFVQAVQGIPVPRRQ